MVERHPIPVIERTHIEKLKHDLQIEVHYLERLLEVRSLTSPGEGTKPGIDWPAP